MFLTLHGSTSAELREHYIRWWFVPLAAELLRREGVGSVTLAFAQHWDNMIDEEVEEAFFVSPSPTPGWPMEEVEWSLLCGAFREIRGVPYDPFAGLRDHLVPAFAPFCRLDGHDEMSREEAFLPYAVARMNDGQLQVEIVGRLQRPDEEVSPFVIPVVPRVERARCGEPIPDAERRLATHGDAPLNQAIEMASILVRNAYAQLNGTVGDPNGDARVQAWLQMLRGI
jgi:hypothetical protein